LSAALVVAVSGTSRRKTPRKVVHNKSNKVSGNLNLLTTDLNFDKVTQFKIFTGEWFFVSRLSTNQQNQPSPHEDEITFECHGDWQ
jgi:hypothetical protein